MTCERSRIEDFYGGTCRWYRIESIHPKTILTATHTYIITFIVPTEASRESKS